MTTNHLVFIESAVADLGLAKVQEVLGNLIENGVRKRILRTSAENAPPKEADLPEGSGGRIPLSEQPLAERVAERIVGIADFLPAHFLEEGAIVQKAVARIALTTDHAGLPAGSGWGTGWLVSPSLLLTNNHVIPNAAFCSKVRVEFNYQLDYHGNELQSDAYTFDPDDVFYSEAGWTRDFTLVRLAPKNVLVLVPEWASHPPGGAALAEWTPNPFHPTPRSQPLSSMRPLPSTLRHPLSIFQHAGERWGYLQLPRNGVRYSIGQRMNVVQHPAGRRKEVSVHSNQIASIQASTIRYTSDTEGGSSGSAVFNNAWEPVALHHAAGDRDSTGRWLNNEGIRLDVIVQDIRDRFQDTPTGRGILEELGLFEA